MTLCIKFISIFWILNHRIYPQNGNSVSKSVNIQIPSWCILIVFSLSIAVSQTAPYFMAYNNSNHISLSLLVPCLVGWFLLWVSHVAAARSWLGLELCWRPLHSHRAVDAGWGQGPPPRCFQNTYIWFFCVAWDPAWWLVSKSVYPKREARLMLCCLLWPRPGCHRTITPAISYLWEGNH